MLNSILTAQEIEQLYFSTLEANNPAIIDSYNEAAIAYNKGKSKFLKSTLLTVANFEAKRAEAFKEWQDEPMQIVNKKPAPKAEIPEIPELAALDLLVDKFDILIKCKYSIEQIDALITPDGWYMEPTKPGELDKALNQQQVIVGLNAHGFNQNQIVEIAGFAKANVAWTFSKFKLTNTVASKRADGKTQKEIILELYSKGICSIDKVVEITGIKKANVAWYFTNQKLINVRATEAPVSIASIDAQIGKLLAIKAAMAIF